jgi:hypothetical protein
MPGRQAKILSDAEVDSMLAWYEKRRYPHRDKVAVLISVKAGLRVIKPFTNALPLGPTPGHRHQIGYISRPQSC